MSALQSIDNKISLHSSKPKSSKKPVADAKFSAANMSTCGSSVIFSEIPSVSNRSTAVIH